MNTMEKFVSRYLLLLLALGVAAGFVPQANAPPSLQSRITATTSISGNNYAVDITSNGTVFANVDSDVYRSIDSGVSWTKVLDRPTGHVYFLRADSQDRIFSAAYNSTGGSWNNDIYRSTDYGATWARVLDAVPKIWRLAEMSNGTLLINTYATGQPGVIYKSDDGGSTWITWQDLTSWGNDHIHFVRVNPYNDDVWVGLGDKSLASVPTLARWESGASSWTIIYNTTSDWMYTDIVFDSDYGYLIPDRSAFRIYRLPHRGVWTDRVEVLDLWSDDSTSPSGIPYSMMAAVYDDGLIVVPTDRETVMASTDGLRWLKVFQTAYEGSGAWRFDCVSQRRDSRGFWYFLSDRDETIYRASVTATDVRQQFTMQYNDFVGTVETQQMRIPVENDTLISLNTTAPTILVSAVGLTKGNFISNPSFESGNMSGWTVGGSSASYAMSTVDSYDGVYSLQVNKTTADADDFWIQTASPVSLHEYGELFFAFAYIKANRTDITAEIEVGYYDNQGNWTLVGMPYSDTQSTSWIRRTTIAQRSFTPRQIYVRFVASTHVSYNYTMYLDATLFERKVTTAAIKRVDDGDTIVYKAGKKVPTASTSLYGCTETQNINITIPGHGSLVHYGNLTERTTIHKTFSLTCNNFDLYVQVAGSNQLLLIITYGHPKLVYTTAELITETYENRRLTLSIDSSAGTMSTTKVYVGDKEQPTEVIGATSWSYDSSTTTLTVVALHSSSITIVIRWSLMGDVNDDGTVNALDLSALNEAFGSIGGPPSSSNWNQDADLDVSNKIDAYDLRLVGKNYGKTS